MCQKGILRSVVERYDITIQYDILHDPLTRIILHYLILITVNFDSVLYYLLEDDFPEKISRFIRFVLLTD